MNGFSIWTNTSSKCFSIVRVGISGFWSTSRPERLSKSYQVTVGLKHSPLRKSYALLYGGEGVPAKLQGRRRMLGALYRFDWYLIFS